MLFGLGLLCCLTFDCLVGVCICGCMVVWYFSGGLVVNLVCIVGFVDVFDLGGLFVVSCLLCCVGLLLFWVIWL